MYRSVTVSREAREARRRAVHRLEGVVVGLAVFFAVFLALGWLRL